MVMPSDERFASVSQNSRRETGSTPVVGSSSNKIFGSVMSAHASASFCFMPPDSRPASRSLKRCMSNMRSEEHTSELQSLRHLVCRLLLEKKKKQKMNKIIKLV